MLVVGSVNSDLALRVPRLPSRGESLIGKDYRRVAGGKGANQAVAVARLGASVTFVGKTGADPDGEALIATLSAEGVRTHFVSRCSSSPTGLAVITIDDEGDNAIVVIPGANHEVTETTVGEAFRVGSYDALLMQFEIPHQTVVAASHLADARAVPVVIDAGPSQSFPLEQLRGVHVLSPNESETFMLTGIKPETTQDAEKAAEILLQRSRARAVVLKLGDRGALLCDRNGACEQFPAHPINAVDTTAAGDAFTAAVTVEYLRTGDIRRAVILGNVAGAIAAMKLGAQPSLPTAVELEDFCTKHSINGY